MNIFFIGDIVGKPGRKAVIKTLPALRKKHQADFVIANGENLAHGRGATKKTLNQIFEAGVDFVTSGNHWDNQPEMRELICDTKLPFIRPANYTTKQPGQGYKIVQVRTKKILIINLMGCVFTENGFSDPFKALDKILKDTAQEKPDIVLIDFHGEATSETKALGLYADGRITALVGTHTHVPTADAEVLPKGSGYITDVGMVGSRYSVLGLNPQVIIKHFLTSEPFKFEIDETSETDLSYVVIKTKVSNKTKNPLELCDKIEQHTDLVKS